MSKKSAKNLSLFLLILPALLASVMTLTLVPTESAGQSNGQSGAITAGQTASRGGVRTPTLEERLTLGLRARRPSEKAFIEAVVDTVNRGKLPLRLVDRTFFWARGRAPKQGGKYYRRPIIYFQPALRIQADRLRIKIRKNAPPQQS